MVVMEVPSSALELSPLMPDLDVAIGVLSRTEYSMRALHDISPSMRRDGKLPDAVRSLTEIHQETNIDWAEQLQDEHQKLSHFILKLREIAEDSDFALTDNHCGKDGQFRKTENTQQSL